MTQKSTNLNDFATVTVKGNDYKVNFWFMAKSEAVDRMKNAYLSKKKQDKYKNKKIFIIVMSNNMPETMTKQQRYSKNQRKVPRKR